ncbi:hypothetical protein Pint_33496 [Pistacia integerrima]|uniref:Uncharacterized protein n=1 Tax=Pistacia integerrima TaxID=434235 RepID=A0ACC0X3W1_9ROSI|nr:hypothetical protein Pint_33496 [Pistacia integerrima]
MQNLLKEKRVALCVVLETRVSSINCEWVSNGVFHSWCWVSNVEFGNRDCRIAIEWDPNMVNLCVVGMMDQNVLLMSGEIVFTFCDSRGRLYEIH